MLSQLSRQYEDLPAEAQRQLADFAEFLRQKYKGSASVEVPRSTDLKNEPFIGMWRDREDLADSSGAVRELRKSEWGDNS